jgi:hypothetical protein
MPLPDRVMAISLSWLKCYENETLPHNSISELTFSVMKLSLPGQVAAQAEFVVNNLQQTDYQHAGRVEPLPAN